MLQNNRKAYFSCMWLILREKKFSIIFVPFYWFDQKQLLKQIQILLRISHFSNLLRKTNFLSHFVLLSEIVIFGLKREVFNELPENALKQQNDNLAACGSLWGEFFLIFFICTVYCFEQKGLFTTNPNFPLDLLLFKLVEKNKLSKYFWAPFLDSIFWTIKRYFQWISPKMLQNNCKAYFSCLWLVLREKKVFDNICSLLLVWSITVVKTNPNFALDFPLFKLVKKNKLSEYFCTPFWDSHFMDKMRIFQWISHKMLQTNRKGYFVSMVLIFRRKTFFVNICPLLLVWSKIVV